MSGLGLILNWAFDSSASIGGSGSYGRSELLSSRWGQCRHLGRHKARNFRSTFARNQEWCRLLFKLGARTTEKNGARWSWTRPTSLCKELTRLVVCDCPAIEGSKAARRHQVTIFAGKIVIAPNMLYLAAPVICRTSIHINESGISWHEK